MSRGGLCGRAERGAGPGEGAVRRGVLGLGPAPASVRMVCRMRLCRRCSPRPAQQEGLCAHPGVSLGGPGPWGAWVPASMRVGARQPPGLGRLGLERAPAPGASREVWAGPRRRKLGRGVLGPLTQGCREPCPGPAFPWAARHEGCSVMDRLCPRQTRRLGSSCGSAPLGEPSSGTCCWGKVGTPRSAMRDC